MTMPAIDQDPADDAPPAATLAVVAAGLDDVEALAAALRMRGDATVAVCRGSSPEEVARLGTAAVLVDHACVRQTGWLDRLRRLAPTTVPLVACEADQIEFALARVGEAGEVLRKPLIPAEVANRVARACSRSAQRNHMVASILGNIAQGLCAFGPDLRLEFWNERASSLRGYPAAFLVRGRPYRDFLAYNFDLGMFGDGDREAFLDRMLAPEALGTPFRLQHAADNGKVLDIQRAPLPNGGFVMTYTDITEAKRAEAALRDSERRFRTIVQNSPVPAAVVRIGDGATLFHNPAAARQIADLRARGLIDDDDALNPLWNSALGTDDALPTLRDREISLPAANGSRLWFLRAASRVTFGGADCLFVNWFDVTDVHRSHIALGQSEANLAEAQRIAQVGSWQHDLVRDEVNWSANYFALLGVPATAPPSYTTIQRILHPADAADYDAYFQAAMRTGDGGDREYRIVRPDGKTRTLRTVFRVERDGTGKAIRVAGTTQDITGLRAAEAAMQESEARLRQASALANLGYWVWDAQTDRCKFCSIENAQIHGMTVEQYVRSSASLNEDFSLVHPDDRVRVKALFVALRAGQPFDAQYRIVTPDGEVRHLHEIAKPVFDDEGRVVEEYGVAQDITHLLETERALAESEERFRAVINQSPVAFALTDPDGRLQIVNQMFMRWYRGDQAEVTGLRWADIMVPSLAARMNELDAATLADGAARQIELQMMSSPDNQQIILVSAFPLRDADDAVYAIGHLGVDITAQRIAEERLRHTQKMEAVGQMTGGVAHDFNNLLTAVIGSLDLLRLRLGGDRAAMPLIDTALRASDRGSRLTQQLLAFSRKQVLDSVATDINEVVPGFLPLARTSLRGGHRLETRLAADLPHVLVDRAQLDAALLNLVINARDAMADGGTVTIGTAHRSPGPGVVGSDDDPREGDYVAVFVRDTGVGMTTRCRAQAIEPFFTTKPIGQGSGLGLSMVYGFVKQSGGHLAIDSAPGKGTTVRLFLPALSAESESGRASITTRSQDAPRGKEVILVVEDDADVRRFVTTVLGGLGYTVLQARDAAAARRQMAARPWIDLLLTDLMLPGERDGVAIASEFRTQFPAARVLFTTGYGAEADLGGDAVLHKPYRVDTLAERVRTVLDAS